MNLLSVTFICCFGELHIQQIQEQMSAIVCSPMKVRRNQTSCLKVDPLQ